MGVWFKINAVISITKRRYTNPNSDINTDGLKEDRPLIMTTPASMATSKTTQKLITLTLFFFKGLLYSTGRSLPKSCHISWHFSKHDELQKSALGLLWLQQTSPVTGYTANWLETKWGACLQSIGGSSGCFSEILTGSDKGSSLMSKGNSLTAHATSPVGTSAAVVG